MSDRTHFALLTAVGRGAVATLVLEGPDAAAVIGQRFAPQAGPQQEFEPDRIYFGRWQLSTGQEELVVCRTGPECFEIHCHGGSRAVLAVRASLEALGASEMPAADWADAPRDDAEIRAARTQLPYATTERCLAILLDQRRGAFKQLLSECQHDIRRGDESTATQRLHRAAALIPLGQRLTQPWEVVLAGRANVGKSSLLNALLGYDRALVWDEPGTTRDVVQATSGFHGWSIRLSDTAGLRDGGDTIESEGIRRAQAQWATADLILRVHDLTRDGESPLEVPGSAPQILVGTKCDLPHTVVPPECLATSSVTGAGLEHLFQRIVHTLVPVEPIPGEAIPLTESSALLLAKLTEQLKCGSVAAAGHLLEQSLAG